jgi:DNA-binding YbaB/EbfC family protein
MSDQMPDLQSLMAQAQAMQERLAQAQAEAAEQELVGEASNGMVRVTLTGGGEFRSVRIDPSLIGDVELLEDLLLAALRDVSGKLDALNHQVTSSVMG